MYPPNTHPKKGYEINTNKKKCVTPKSRLAVVSLVVDGQGQNGEKFESLGVPVPI